MMIRKETTPGPAWIQGRNGLVNLAKFIIRTGCSWGKGEMIDVVYMGGENRGGREINGGLQVDATAFDNAIKEYLEAKGFEIYEREFITNVLEIAFSLIGDEANLEHIYDVMDISDEALSAVLKRIDEICAHKKCDRIGGCLKINLGDPNAHCKCDPR